MEVLEHSMKLLKEPLLHFLVLGGIIFLLARTSGPQGPAATSIDPRITITSATINLLEEGFESLHRRAPTDAELRELIDAEVLDEAYVREGFRLGLERDDPIVKRRLREKMQIVAEHSEPLPTPDDATLQAFLSKHAESFRSDPRVTLRQIFFDPEKLDDPPDSQLSGLLEALRKGEAVEGHETLLPSFRPDAPLRSLAATFGSSFAAALESLPLGQWSGPLRSGFGWHLVKVEKFEPGQVPPLGQIRDEVREAWERAETDKRVASFDRKLLERYEVSIEWPVPNKESP